MIIATTWHIVNQNKRTPYIHLFDFDKSSYICAHLISQHPLQRADRYFQHRGIGFAGGQAL